MNKLFYEYKFVSANHPDDLTDRVNTMARRGFKCEGVTFHNSNSLYIQRMVKIHNQENDCDMVQ